MRQVWKDCTSQRIKSFSVILSFLERVKIRKLHPCWHHQQDCVSKNKTRKTPTDIEGEISSDSINNYRQQMATERGRISLPQDECLIGYALSNGLS